LILFVLGIALVLSYHVNVRNDEYPKGTVRGQLEK